MFNFCVFMFNWAKVHSPLKEETRMESVAGTSVYLLSDLSSSVTGEVIHVDAGYHAMAMPDMKDLKASD